MYENEKPNQPHNTGANKQGSRKRTGKKKYQRPDVKCTPKQDPFWYAKDQKAVENMASIPFLEILGEGLTPSDGSDSVPAIVTFHYNHVCGSEQPVLRGMGSYATRAANAYFQYVTQGFTGGVDFEAPDLLMTALAAESLFAKLIEGKRAYGLLRYYLQYNKYYARDIITALGFDFDDLSANMANFRTEYNIRVAQINKMIAVPHGFFIGDRWEFLASYIFTDTDSPEYSTAYAYVADKFLLYNPTRMKTGTALTWFKGITTKPITGWGVAQFFSDVDHMLQQLNDSDTRAMFGAIRRVYSDAQLKKVSELEDEFVTTIVKHDVVAAAIHNAVWTGSYENVVGIAPRELLTTQGATPTDVALFQDETGLLHGWIGHRIESSTKYPKMDNYLLDMYDHMVNPGNILDITANMEVVSHGPAYEMEDSSGNKTKDVLMSIVRCEIITDVKVWFEMPVAGFVGVSVQKFLFSSTSTVNLSSTFARLSHLDSHPLICVIGNASSSGGHPPTYYIGEIDKYTLVSSDVLAKMHQRSMYQLLSMPENSKSVT